jgi:hypothetical protein
LLWLEAGKGRGSNQQLKTTGGEISEEAAIGSSRRLDTLNNLDGRSP